jgi:hypothetical protein
LAGAAFLFEKKFALQAVGFQCFANKLKQA